MSQKLGLVPSNEVDQKTLVSESYIGAKLVEPDDLVLNRLKAHLGVFAIANRVGLVSPDYSVFRPADGTNVRFFEYVLRSSACRTELRTRAKGIVEGFWRLYTPDFYQILLPVPPVEEQRLIVRFLDTHGALTARLTRAKQRVIKLLEEQKQAIIHRAVTRGLGPGVCLKPSGISWLGDIPEHWEIMALKRIATSWCDGPFGSGLKSSHYADEGTRVIRLQNIGHGYFKNTDPAFIPNDYYQNLGDHSVIAGDLIVAGLGDENHPAGRACVAPRYIEPAMVKADCFRFRLNQNCVESEFMALLLTATAVSASATLSTGATRQRINLQASAARPVLVPPKDEQREIIAEVHGSTCEVETTIATIGREIAFLREFRTRLIADVVTGKLDVRGAAAALPEITKTERIDEPIDGEDVEEAIEDVENEAVAA
jgi:type I restriction enzyme S subunit